MSKPVVRLKDLCSLITKGTTPTSIGFDFSDAGVGFLRVQNVSGGSINFQNGTLFITESVHQELRRSQILPGDILLSIAGTIGRTGIVPANAPGLNCNQALAIVRPDDKVFRPFLRHWLESAEAQSQMRGATVTGTIQNLSLAQVGGLLVPLPPLPEQRRIAAILDQADALRAKRREALARLDSLTQAIFMEMFGDVEGNDWVINSVADIAESSKGSIRTGPFGSQLLHSEFVDDGVVVLGIDNAVRNEFRWGERRFISPQKYQELKRYTVLPGDVLITIMGTCGRCAVVPADIPVAINTKHICCITLDSEKCLPSFLHSYFLMHPMARKYLEQTAKGAIMDGLNMGIIKAMPMPLVPMGLQHEFEARLDALQKTKSANIAAAAELDALFACLQHRAFRGEL